MRIAYIDTSCLVAIAFGEAGATKVASRLERMDRLFGPICSRQSCGRRLLAKSSRLTGRTTLEYHRVYPNRPLSGEFERVMVEGYVKGADLWHLACALFLAPEPKDSRSSRSTKRQEEVARRLGFPL